MQLRQLRGVQEEVVVLQVVEPDVRTAVRALVQTQNARVGEVAQVAPRTLARPAARVGPAARDRRDWDLGVRREHGQTQQRRRQIVW